MDRWVGKTAVVTGASAGIGAAIAVALANEGLHVVGLARRPQLIVELNSQVKPGKGRIYARMCDVSSRDEIIEVFATINKEFGGINIVVNNAARMKIGTFTDAGEKIVSDDDIEILMKTNTLGLITGCREGAKYMKQTGEQGHIINISSVAAHYVLAALGMPRTNIYYGTKHAVRATSEAMRLEFSHAKTDIKITCVSPGAVRTDILASALEGEDPSPDWPSKEAPVDSFPFLEPSDVAEAVLSVLATPPRVNIAEVIIRPLGETF